MGRVPGSYKEDPMSANVPVGDYMTVEGATLWWRPDDPTRIHYTTNSDEFTNATGDSPGIRVVFSADPMSADYSPRNFNRAARALRRLGKPAPDEIPEPSRRLRDRFSGSLTLRATYPRP
jgi:hypothetical protein